MDESLTQIAISLPNRLLGRIETTAQRSGQSRSRIVRDLLELALNQEPGEEYVLFLKAITVPAAVNGRPTGEYWKLEASPNVNLLPQKLVLFSDRLDDIDIMNSNQINVTGGAVYPIPASLFGPQQPINIPLRREIIPAGVPFTLLVANKTATNITLSGIVLGRGFIKKLEPW